MKTKSSFIFNGNRKIKGPYKYKAVGTVIDYQKTRSLETIDILGPIAESVYLSVRRSQIVFKVQWYFLS